MELTNDIVSLFPYQIKDVTNFYFRNHPKALHPDSQKFKLYWGDFLRKCIEGVWVNDNGTWVFMMPKLFFYINYVRIQDAARDRVFPRLRDNEWIIFTYTLCSHGFSGFEKDEEYTCHELVGKFQNDPLSLDDYELESIPKSCYHKDGGFKKYINAWDYLTRHYLLDNPAKEPLGNALYDNPLYNVAILSGRGSGKSYTQFLGEFLHEFLFSGVRSYADVSKINRRMLFGMGSGDTRPLDRSISNIKDVYYNMPGRYKFRDEDKQDYMGPFYKKVQGIWKVGNQIEQLIKRKKGGSIDVQGSLLQMVALTKENAKVGAGDRFKLIMVEEWGFLGNALTVHAANDDSLKSEGVRVGRAIYTGTSGEMEAIKEPKEMFENPAAYSIYGIPNYWKNLNKKIGLFIPTTYILKKFKDKNGNTRIKEAYDFLIQQREIDRELKDSLSYEESVMFNPLNPDEMLRPINSSGLPKQEAQSQINRIQAYDIFSKRAQVGSLHFDPTEPRGVRWDKDMRGMLKPIIDIRIDDEITNTSKEGAVIIYEQPPKNIPQDLYWIVYDPASQSGDGSSFHSVLVYKHFYAGPHGALEDNIVAEWIGRKETLDANYAEVIKLAKYFNARIFPEVNIAGFVDWCYKVPAYAMLLEGDAYHLEVEIHGGNAIKRSNYKVGTRMDARKKEWCLKRLRDWLLTAKNPDEDGVPEYRTIDKLYSLRVLNEIVAYTGNKKENYDHISSLLLLMLLIGKIEGLGIGKVKIEEEDALPLPANMIDYSQLIQTPKRARILNY